MTSSETLPVNNALGKKGNLILLGALAGDIIGAPFEYISWKKLDFPLFSPSSTYTDDSILTLAVARAIFLEQDYGQMLLQFAHLYPDADYGGSFRAWMTSANPQPYNSLGNGSAMRASPVGWAFESLDETLRQAELSAAPTHNHPEGIKGAQATAAAIFMLRKGMEREALRSYIETTFGYNLDTTCDAIRKVYTYDVTCPGTVPPAIVAFLESGNFEDAIRRAVSLGGDADTLAAITGSIAEAAYGVPMNITKEIWSRMPDELWDIVLAFSSRYAPGGTPEFQTG
jgi:ADP-ribosylglycohydrolase